MVTQSTLVVRAATQDDAEEISKLNGIVQRLHQAALPALFKYPSPESFPLVAVRAMIADASRAIALAEIGALAVGYIIAHVQRRPETEFRFASASLYVDHLAVSEHARERGVGTALMDFVEGRARSLGLASLELDYWTFNQSARSFFERRGYDSVNVRMFKALSSDSG